MKTFPSYTSFLLLYVCILKRYEKPNFQKLKNWENMTCESWIMRCYSKINLDINYIVRPTRSRLRSRPRSRIVLKTHATRACHARVTDRSTSVTSQWRTQIERNLARSDWLIVVIVFQQLLRARATFGVLFVLSRSSGLLNEWYSSLSFPQINF